MKVQPVASPAAIQQPQATDNRAKAIAAFQNASQPPQQVVQNQNAISAEEMGAIMQPGQSDNQEESQEDTELPPEQEAKPEPPKEDPALSRQFAQLARQEKSLRIKAQQQEQAYKAREQALQAREQELSSKGQEYSPDKYISRDRIKQDALTVLAESGVSYDELVQQVLNQQPKDPRVEAQMSELRNEIKALRQANDDAKKSYADNQTQAYQAAVKQIKNDVIQLVSQNPEFETIKATRSVQDVVELITQTYDKDGVLLSVEEAAEQVENYLVEEAMKLNQIEKIKRKIQASAPNVSSKSAQALAEKAVKTQPQMKTLTNATSSSRQLSAKERAILAFKGELKS